MQVNIVKILMTIILMTIIIDTNIQKIYAYSKTSSAVMQGSPLDFDTHFAIMFGNADVYGDKRLIDGGNIISRQNEPPIEHTEYKNIQLGVDLKIIDQLNATIYLSNTTTTEYQGASPVFTMGLGTALSFVQSESLNYKIDYEAHYNSFNFRKIKENKTLNSKSQMIEYRGDGYLVGASIVYKHVSIMAFCNRNRYKLSVGKTNIPHYDALIDRVIPKHIVTTLKGIAIGVDF